MSTVTDAVNVKKNVGESPVKRTIAKIRHPVRAHVSGSAAERAQDQAVSEEEEKHFTTGEYAGSAGHAVVREALQYLQSDEGDEDMRKVFGVITEVLFVNLNEMVVSEQTVRMAGREMVCGVSEGLAKTLTPQSKKLPKEFTVLVLPVVAIFGGLFMLGLLLALWRFALFGLHS